MSITSDEVNYLVYRYLHESGFKHAAFTFASESLVHRANINGIDVPAGALVAFLQKGIQYLEIEASLDAEANGSASTHSYDSALDLLNPSRVQSRTTLRKTKDYGAPTAAELSRSSSLGRSVFSNNTNTEEPSSSSTAMSKLRSDGLIDGASVETREHDFSNANRIPSVVDPLFEEEFHDPVPDTEVVEEEAEEEDPLADIDPRRIVPSSRVQELLGHTNDIFSCSWNPVGDSIASGYGDSTARIWRGARVESPSNPELSEIIWDKPIILFHGKGSSRRNSSAPSNQQDDASLLEQDNSLVDGADSDFGQPSAQCEITAVDWSSDGKSLATGSYDGVSRIWNADGSLVHTLLGHTAAVLSLRWSPSGERLLSGSADRTAIIWNPRTGTITEQFSLHVAPTLDVDWRDDEVFASCSTDRMIYVCRVGEASPLQSFSGHLDEVNSVKWDPSGQLLASCSDDRTAKIWSLVHANCLHTLSDHEKEIYSLRWSPTGAGSLNPNLPLYLATASFDTTVRVWDPYSGIARFVLDRHRSSVYAVSFSPDGLWLASGSFDGCLHVWSLKDGSLVQSYRGSGGIFEISWNSRGDRIAASFSDSSLRVIDIRL